MVYRVCDIVESLSKIIAHVPSDIIENSIELIGAFRDCVRLNLSVILPLLVYIVYSYKVQMVGYIIMH
jgi:hypothetical protein